MLGVALNGDDEIEASLSGGAAAGGMERRAVLTHLKHLASYEDAAAGGRARSESANHGAQCLWIGIVAVVEDGGAGNFDDLAALVAGGERRDSSHGGIEFDACLERDGKPGDGVGGIVRAK